MAKAPVKMIPLKKLNVTEAPAGTEEVAEKLTVIPLKVDGNTVFDYNDADAQAKAWEKEKERLRPTVKDAGLNYLYDYNTANSASPVKTVKVTDATGTSCNVTVSDTYGKAQLDPETLLPQLARLGVKDPNKLVAERLIVSFDSSVFYDANGNLRKAFYEAVLGSLQDLAACYSATCPISSRKVVSPVDGFAEKRWSQFTVEQQATVSAVFPATVMLKPVAPAKSKI